ncbi:MAG: fabG [Solimicrobium sp.]|jgi:3-oxoacyl-[acyl-carrier protein] reductase|nr:fabG [Solimicrobium sp.]
MKPIFDLSGQIVLVTGASRGIGRAIATLFAQQGATVIGTATTEAGAQNITAYLKGATEGGNGLNGHGAVLNVCDPAASLALVEKIQKEYGGLSVLVNNAGITQDQLAMRMKEEEWDTVIATNLTAVARLCRAVLRNMMKAKYGRIINITSVVGSSGNPGQMNYAAAKAGVAGMSRALAREIGSRNITVNCIAPGFIDTDMTKALNEQQSESILQQIPIGRLGQPQEIAAAAVFLASAEASYITGTTMHVNGGMYLS